MTKHEGQLARLEPVLQVTGEVKHATKMIHEDYNNMLIPIARFGCYCGETVELRNEESYGTTCEGCGLVYQSRQIIMALGFGAVPDGGEFSRPTLALYNKGRDLLKVVFTFASETPYTTRDRVDLDRSMSRIMDYIKEVTSLLERYSWKRHEEALMNAVKNFYINIVFMPTRNDEQYQDYASKFPRLADYRTSAADDSNRE